MNDQGCDHTNTNAPDPIRMNANLVGILQLSTVNANLVGMNYATIIKDIRSPLILLAPFPFPQDYLNIFTYNVAGCSLSLLTCSFAQPPVILGINSHLMVFVSS